MGWVLSWELRRLQGGEDGVHCLGPTARLDDVLGVLAHRRGVLHDLLDDDRRRAEEGHGIVPGKVGRGPDEGGYSPHRDIR